MRLSKFVTSFIKIMIMNALRRTALLVAMMATMLSACEKSTEISKNSSEAKAAGTADVVYPLTGTSMSNGILPKRKLPKAILTKGFYAFPHIKVQLIDTVCAEYLEKTKKVDLSYIPDGQVNHIFGKGEFTFYADPDFVRAGLRKLSPGPKGWWTHWNFSPYTESENPVVLFALDRRYGTKNPTNSISLELGAPVTTFGFEIAPNTIGKVQKVVVTYNNALGYRGQTMFLVEQTISSPSGARLIAAKSSIPFTYVRIDLPDQKYSSEGFAIANIRYELAK